MGHMIATLRAEINSYQAELTRLRAEKAELVEEMSNKDGYIASLTARLETDIGSLHQV